VGVKSRYGDALFGVLLGDSTSDDIQRQPPGPMGMCAALRSWMHALLVVVAVRDVMFIVRSQDLHGWPAGKSPLPAENRLAVCITLSAIYLPAIIPSRRSLS